MKKYVGSFLLALLLHASLMGSFGLSFLMDDTPLAKLVIEKPPEIIHASVLDESWVVAKALELKIAQQQRAVVQQQQKVQSQQLVEKIQAQQSQLEQLKNEQLAGVQLAREQLAKEKQAFAAEKKAQLVQLKQRALKQKQQQAAEVKRLAEMRRLAVEKAAIKRQELERVRVAKVKAEKVKQAALKAAVVKQAKITAEKKRQAQRLAVARAAKEQVKTARLLAEKSARIQQAIASASHFIQQKVIKNWNQPSAAVKGLVCTIQVEIISSGDVMSVKVIKSSGNILFDESAERAVRKASPLPVPQNKDVFKKFRRFSFEFAPL